MRPRRWLTAALVFAGVAHADPAWRDVRVEVPERPYLLVDVPRRYTTAERAVVRVHRRVPGRVQLALFRVRDARAFVEASVSRQGVSVAQGPWGEEAEALMHATAALPRAGQRVTLVTLRDVDARARERVRRAIGVEDAVYDSHEGDEGLVETWGVSAGAWGTAEVDLGALPAGTYLARVHDAMWATSALLSVGDTVLVTRRGDARDVVRVSDPEGAPLRDVEVEAVGDEGAARARTDAAGEATLPASASPTRRVWVSRGDELAWTDVVHTQLPPCDTRVYLGTGRPVYREGDEVRVRGHVRGCGPMAGARVRVYPTRAGERGETVVADAEGNFTATLVAAAEVGAEVDGRAHPRTLNLDHRALPHGAVRVAFDRAWAVAGSRVTLTAWPTAGARFERVQFRWEGGEASAAITDDAPASVEVTVPPTTQSLTRFDVEATATGPGQVVVGHASMWTGHARDALSLTGDAMVGATDANLTLTLAARDLGGDASPGEVQLAVSGSDGNHAVGDARWRAVAQVPASGRVEVPVHLAGNGPWWVTATRGDATASAAVWERPRPPTLAARGALAVLPEADEFAPGSPVRVTVRTPSLAWVTLEQGGVWASQRVTPGADGAARVSFDAPAGARGHATVVATRVHEGRVESASAVAEVASAEHFAMTAVADRRAYDPGAHARVIVRTRTTAQRPKEAVLTAWLEDVGWWSLGAERQPTVDAYFRGTGRPASGGDSQQPLGYGAEEGRRLDSGMFWNRERVEGTTFRHAWGYGGALANAHVRGDLTALATSIARAGGMQSATVCPARVRAHGVVDLELRDLPWDLAALKLAERTHTWASRSDTALRFSCDEPLGGTGAGGLGSGSGTGYGGGGAGVGRAGERFEGTRWFLASMPIGPSGEVTLDVPLPAEPGRWRLHTLAIAHDGAGAEADTDVDTVAPYMTSVRLARALAPGDELEGEVLVRNTRGERAPLTLRVAAEGAVSLMSPATVTVTPDAAGVGRASVRVRGASSGAGRVTATVSRDAQAVDRADATVRVREDIAAQPVDLRAVVADAPTDVDLTIPALAGPATLRVRADAAMTDAVREALDALRAPRWEIGGLHVDRLASLRALESAVAALPTADARPLRASLSAAIAGEAAALRTLRGSDGEIAWWSQIPGHGDLTATALALGVGDPTGWAEAWSSLRARVDAARGPSAGLLAAAMSRGTPADRRRVGPLIDRSDPNDLVALTWSLRAARNTADTARTARLVPLLRAAIDRTTSNDLDRPCAGVAWFLCMGREGTRGVLAAAARTLLEADPASRPWALRAARWLSLHPDPSIPWVWGSADADVLALLGRIGQSSQGSLAVVVRLGDTVLARGDARVGLDVTVREAGTLRLSFEAARDRFSRVGVTGSLRVAPPSAMLGTAGLTRAFTGDGDASVMTLTFTLPRDTSRVEIHAPLPAGDELAQGAGTPVRQRDLRGTWASLDGPVGDSTAVVSRLDDGVRVRFARLRAGTHAVQIPLARVGRGTFHAGSAWLRSADDAVWSITPAYTATR